MKPLALKVYPVFEEDVPHFVEGAAIKKSMTATPFFAVKERMIPVRKSSLVNVAFRKNILSADAACFVHDRLFNPEIFKRNAAKSSRLKQ